MTEENDQRAQVISLLDRAKKKMEENAPSPPSDEALMLARKYLKFGA